MNANSVLDYAIKGFFGLTILLVVLMIVATFVNNKARFAAVDACVTLGGVPVEGKSGIVCLEKSAIKVP